MCSDPQTKDGQTFACRRCNACIATRRRNWVARSMMETLCHPHGLVVALTYDEDTQENRDAARMFAYGDVRAFIQRITAALRRIDKRHYVRFVCAGEQGSRTDRVHWHLILWSSYDLRKLGTVSRFGKPISDLDAMLTVGKRKRRLHWSLWADANKRPKGFLTFQELNEVSASYVLSYCLKDQFTVEKSEGSMREHKAENFATGLFRMSKRPAIGEQWLMRKMERIVANGAVLPSINLTVPGLSGYYQPAGLFRKKLLWALTAANTLTRNRTGSDAPQWDGLLASLTQFQPDLEVLRDEQETEQTDEWQSPQLAAKAWAEIDAKHRWRSDEYRRSRAARLRGWSLLCGSCLDSPDHQRDLPQGGWSRPEGSPVIRWRDGATGNLAPYGYEIEKHFGSNNCCSKCAAEGDLHAIARAGQSSYDRL